MKAKAKTFRLELIYNGGPDGETSILMEKDDDGNVVSLSLNFSRITDAGMENLKGLTSLTSLKLDYTKITDAGLVHLKGLTKLQFLSLSGTKITDAGVAELEKALPNCIIYDVYSAEPGPVANKKLPQ